MPKHPGGRPAVWGARQKRLSITLPPDHIEFLRQLGQDNISNAIRLLIVYYQTNTQKEETHERQDLHD